MKYYFYSPLRGIAKLNSENFYINQNVNVFSEPTGFLQVFLDGNYKESYFHFESKIKKNMRLIDLYGGFLLIPEIVKERNRPYKQIYSGSFSGYNSETRVEIISDGGIKLKLQNAYHYSESEIPFYPKNVELKQVGNSQFVAILLKAESTCVTVFDATTLELVFSSLANSVSIDSDITIIKKLTNYLCHEITEVWEKGVPFTIKRRSVNYSEKAVLPELIPYAFLEEIRVAGSFTRFLSDNMKAVAKNIPEFLGDFEFFIPPIEKVYPNIIALVYESQAKYLRLTIENNLISDINLELYPIKPLN